MRQILLVVTLSLLGGCAVSPWPQLHEPRHPHQTACAGCEGFTHGGVVVAPDALSDRQRATARLCGIPVPGR